LVSIASPQVVAASMNVIGTYKSGSN
jgi:hypothetical protein